MKKKNIKKQFPIILSVIAIVLAAYATFTTVQLKNDGQNDVEFKSSVFGAIDDYIAEKNAPPPTGPVEVSLDDDAMKGDENAPVTIVEFSDYECPFCGRYVKETYPQIVKNYIDTGKVNYVFRDFPLGFHASAKPAANAAECIREQGGDSMYFEYHDVLFANNTELGVEKLKEYAATFSIDQSQFASCVDENKYADEVEADFTEGGSYGVRGTPAFFINGTLIAGAQPYENFETAIEAALAEVE